MNKKGNLGYGIIAFAAIIIGLLFFAPIGLKVVRSSITEFSNAINVTSPEASTTMTGIQTSFENLWDWVIFLCFGINVLVLLVSAFFIDTHPVFLIFYIMTLFFLFIFAPNMIDAVDTLWAHSAFSEETGLFLDLTDFLRLHFESILLGVAVLSGVVIYAKIKLFT